MPRVRPIFNSPRSNGAFLPRPTVRRPQRSSVEAAWLRARTHTLGARVGLAPTLDHTGRGIIAGEIAQGREHQNAAAEITRRVEARAARVAVLIGCAFAPFLAAVLEHA